MTFKVEIGSDIPISLNLLLSSIKFKKIKGLFLSRGRDCIQHILDLERFTYSEKILLPSYICPSVVHQIEKNNVGISYYKLNEKLEIDIEDIQEKLDKNIKCLFVVNFFGFEQPSLSFIRDICKAKNVSLVIDNVQSPLSKEEISWRLQF